MVFKPVLQAPLPCTFCMCPLSDTPDSTHQLVSRDCKTWTGCVDKGHIQNVQGRGACRTGLKTTAVEDGADSFALINKYHLFTSRCKSVKVADLVAFYVMISLDRRAFWWDREMKCASVSSCMLGSALYRTPPACATYEWVCHWLEGRIILNVTTVKVFEH